MSEPIKDGSAEYDSALAELAIPTIVAEMSTTTAPVPTVWNAVDFVVNRQIRDKRPGLLTETLAWVAAVGLFRDTETQTHYLAAPTEDDRRQHKAILASLIAGGERLLARVHGMGGLPENLDGIKTADLDAMVEELRTTNLQWYGDMTTERREQILKELFNVSAR